MSATACLQRKHSNTDAIVYKYLIQHLRHIGPVQPVKTTANSRHGQPCDTMLLTVSAGTLKTATQIVECRPVKVAIFRDKIVDVTFTTFQNPNFTNTNIC